MRGVHPAHPGRYGPAQGSSPHARGPRHGIAQDMSHQGIIPACAGSTVKTGEDFSSDLDHPRMRGVHLIEDVGGQLNPGSSPHARGPLTAPDTDTPVLRIIPACAGST